MGARSGGGASGGMGSGSRSGASSILSGGSYAEAAGNMFEAFLSGDKAAQKKAIDHATKVISKMGYQEMQKNLNGVSESISYQTAKPTHPIDKAMAKHNKTLLKIYQQQIKKYL